MKIATKLWDVMKNLPMRKIVWRFVLALLALNILSFAVYFACIGHAYLTLED